MKYLSPESVGGKEARYHRSFLRTAGAWRVRGETLPRAPMEQRYLIVVRGDSIAHITEEALHFLYFFLSRALAQHRAEGKNGEYEDFALGVLGLLQRYRHLYTSRPEASEGDSAEENRP